MQEREGGEARGVEEVVDRLATKYPGVERAEIEKIVAEEHQSFDGHPVRDFVPVLVEKHAKTRVKHLAAHETQD
ncbi:three-helix bundle dimerization domain-containing protein [Agromyces sp. Marseille-Q5079]|uniref:three-helix bundle dimerization domain-containing protein n=1 Tax=Agromyces sp. Marseille-Q5079 TaxID=3439059 RepID=UPI003D9CB478